MVRKSWDRYFMDIAFSAGERSTCPRAAVGAVIVIDNEIVSTGYNGAPIGAPHCEDEGCIIDPETNHCVRAVHAEVNAIIRAKRNLKGATIYCTHRPCTECSKAIANAGISMVKYAIRYYDNRCRLWGVLTQDELLDQFGIAHEQL